MCGRYELNATSKELRSFVGDLYVSDTDMPTAGEQNPGDPLLIVTKNSDGYFPSNARWGLVSQHLKYEPSKLLINLRSEGLPSKLYYNKLLKNNRCLIPATAFFEWQSPAKHRQKLRISHAKGKALMFAGIFDHHPLAGTTCAILTTAADELFGGNQARMPLMLARARLPELYSCNCPTK
mgnify:CR=1 FL=1